LRRIGFRWQSGMSLRLRDQHRDDENGRHTRGEDPARHEVVSRSCNPGPTIGRTVAENNLDPL